MSRNIANIKIRIAELHEVWGATTDELDGFKDAESIESEVQYLIPDNSKE